MMDCSILSCTDRASVCGWKCSPETSSSNKTFIQPVPVPRANPLTPAIYIASSPRVGNTLWMGWHFITGSVGTNQGYVTSCDTDTRRSDLKCPPRLHNSQCGQKEVSEGKAIRFTDSNDSCKLINMLESGTLRQLRSDRFVL